MKKITVLLLSLLVLVVAGCAGNKAATPPSDSTGSQSSSTGQAQVHKTWSSPPSMQIDPKKSYQAIIHTSMGDITINLFAADAPKTVNNFVFLAKNDFYNGLKFHRVIKNFMIQTGDPNGDGTGGPGYKFADELPPKHPYAPGIVAMANAGPNTNGSQFFICSGPDADTLPTQYTVFGQVVKGMDVVEKISDVKVGPNAQGEMSSPLQPVYMKSVDIVEK